MTAVVGLDGRDRGGVRFDEIVDRAVRAERAGRGEERAEFVGGVASGDHEVRLGDNRFAERVGERGLAQIGVRAVDAAVDNGDGHAATGEAAGVVDTGEAVGGVPHGRTRPTAVARSRL